MLNALHDRNYRRWLALWERLGASGNAFDVFRCLVWRYGEMCRSYHTLEHIDHCLTEFEQVRRFAKNPDAVEWAIWYHDAVENPKEKDNVEQSTALATLVIKNVGLPDSFGQLVANLIMTSKHSVIPTDPDARLFVDIDLSILGQDEDYFDEYELRICREYDWMSKEKFVAGRSAILKSFIDRSSIYSTQFFRDKYEARARQNITRSLAQLSQKS